MKTNFASQKGPFDAVVLANNQIGESFFRISLEFKGLAAKAFIDAAPGQFVEIDLTNAPLPPVQAIPEELKDAAQRKILLRRPFSFADITGDPQNAIVEILYCTVGPASLRMAALKPGQTLNALGPLGNGFSVPENKTTALLVSGGMGAGPIQHLTNVLAEKHPKIDLIVFAGARSKKDFPFEPHTFARYKTQMHLSTDDGSLSIKGFVTDSLCSWLEKTDIAADEMIIYSCGPEPMLASLAMIAEKYNIHCQVSMERTMACGIGLCQSCAVECKNPDQDETFYKMCCKDGPVFDGKEVVFEK